MENEQNKKDPLGAAIARGNQRLQQIVSQDDMRTASQIGQVPGVTTQEVGDLLRANKLIGIESHYSETMYPEWQIGADKKLLDGLEEALEILGNNGLTAYGILLEKFPDDRNKRNFEAKRDGQKIHVLRRLQAIARGDFVC